MTNMEFHGGTRRDEGYYVPAGLMVKIPEAEKKAILSKLNEPFDVKAIKTRKVGSKMASYLEGMTVINRLNDILWEYGWDFVVLEWREAKATMGGKEVRVVEVLGRLKIYGIGEKDAFGIQEMQGGADMLKGAATDALKKAASWFGVGAELYGEDYEDEKRNKEELLQIAKDFDSLKESIFGPIGNPKFLFLYWLKNYVGVETLRGLDLPALRAIKGRLEKNRESILEMVKDVKQEETKPEEPPKPQPVQEPKQQVDTGPPARQQKVQPPPRSVRPEPQRDPNDPFDD